MRSSLRYRTRWLATNRLVGAVAGEPVPSTSEPGIASYGTSCAPVHTVGQTPPVPSISSKVNRLVIPVPLTDGATPVISASSAADGSGAR